MVRSVAALINFQAFWQALSPEIQLNLIEMEQRHCRGAALSMPPPAVFLLPPEQLHDNFLPLPYEHVDKTADCGPAYYARMTHLMIKQLTMMPIPFLSSILLLECQDASAARQSQMFWALLQSQCGQWRSGPCLTATQTLLAE